MEQYQPMNIKKTFKYFSLATFALLFSNLSTAVTVIGSGSTFEINIGDGFDSTDGAEREAVFIAAAQYWADILVSEVPIVIDTEFSSSLFCSTNSATLGSAGPKSRFLSNATSIGLQNNVWYPTALINAYNGSDRFPSDGDITASFNANLGNSDCLASSGWYYGMDGNSPRNKVDFFEVVQHELGHGLGILSLVNSDGIDQTTVDILPHSYMTNLAVKIGQQ